MPHNTPSPQTRSLPRSLLCKTFILIRRFFTGLGVLFFISLLMLVFMIKSMAGFGPPPVQDHTILTYTFEGNLPEVLSAPSLTQPLLGSTTTLHDVIAGLDYGRNDPRVTGFIARIQSNDLGVAQIQELRNAIARFRDSGKFAYVFSTSFGDFSNGMKDYYLAGSFGEIWLQPIGNVSITGLTSQLPFFKGTLDKLGLKADMMARAEFKTAVEPMTRTQPSPENEKMTKRLLSELHGQMVEGMAKSRNLTPEQIQMLIDRAPLSDEQAKAAGLVDRIGYLDQMVDQAREKSGGIDVAKMLEVDLYLAQILDEKNPTHFSEEIEKRFLPEEEKSKSEAAPPSRIALVYGSGAIMPDNGAHSRMAPMMMGGPIMSAEDISIAINTARLDPKVGAIVLRLNSPGGSATASETIARAISEAQEAGKPVIVSMSTAAASGAYWVAAKADKIIAQPATLTGSIGVLGGKIVVGEMLDKIGVNIVTYSHGRNAELWSSLEPFNPVERAKVNALLDATYDAFLQRVSEGRGIPVETLRESLAGGRVWTGAKAFELGLVDGLGGLNTAIEIAKPLVDAENPAQVKVVQYPPEKTPLELLMDMLVNGAPMPNPVTLLMQDMNIAHMGGMLSAYAKLPRF